MEQEIRQKLLSEGGFEEEIEEVATDSNVEQESE